MNIHYWIGEGSDYVCKECKTELHLGLSLIGGRYERTFNYKYINGDTSTLFDSSIKDICPVDEWDLGKWLPGAVEI